MSKRILVKTEKLSIKKKRCHNAFLAGPKVDELQEHIISAF